jgi:hypothetical protein
MKTQHAAWVDRVEASKDLSKEDEDALKGVVESFLKTGAF